MEVCNEFDCSRSEQIGISTAEDIPVGLGDPSVEAISPTAIIAAWDEPVEPNGVIHTYKIRREHLMPCYQL